MDEIGSYFNNKRVLVTGHTGFKGAWLCEWLMALGARVTGFSVDVPSRPSLFETLRLMDRMTHVEGDIRDLASLAGVFSRCEPEVVFHLAAQPLVRRSYTHPKETFDTNVGGTVNLLEAARVTSSVRSLVVITSDKVYENTGSEAGYREEDRLGGKDPYSASKACTELVVSSYARSFFVDSSRTGMASVRAGNVIGGGDWAEDRIVPDCVLAWNAGRPAILRNPRSTRPWQHVLEPLSGYLTVAKALGERDSKVLSESFNFGPSLECCKPVAELVEEMAGHWPGAVSKHVPLDDAKPEAAVLKVVCDKAKERLGWTPRLSFEAGIKMTMEWYRAYYSGNTDMLALTREHIGSFSRA